MAYLSPEFAGNPRVPIADNAAWRSEPHFDLFVHDFREVGRVHSSQARDEYGHLTESVYYRQNGVENTLLCVRLRESSDPIYRDVFPWP
jgi:hypothetical protein